MNNVVNPSTAETLWRSDFVQPALPLLGQRWYDTYKKRPVIIVDSRDGSTNETCILDLNSLRAQWFSRGYFGRIEHNPNRAYNTPRFIFQPSFEDVLKEWMSRSKENKYYIKNCLGTGIANFSFEYYTGTQFFRKQIDHYDNSEPLCESLALLWLMST